MTPRLTPVREREIREKQDRHRPIATTHGLCGDSQEFWRNVESCLSEIDALRAERDELALLYGGKTAGHAYGATNCSNCKKLVNDFYRFGHHAWLCEPCWYSSHEFFKERDTLRAALGKAVEALKWTNDRISVDWKEPWAIGDMRFICSEALAELRGVLGER